jgi:hypothetical protein
MGIKPIKTKFPKIKQVDIRKQGGDMFKAAFADPAAGKRRRRC